MDVSVMHECINHDSFPICILFLLRHFRQVNILIQNIMKEEAAIGEERS